jgi:transforming growth factor-beta-induced protein
LLINTWGDPVTALFSTEGGVFVNGAQVVVADVKTTNGIVHVVDTVLLPPTIVDHATNAGLTGLLTTVGAASGDLGTTLSGTGPFTVFAPTNSAFDDIASVAATLTPDELRDILLFHVLGGTAPVTSGDLANGEVPTLLTGQSVTVDITGPTIEGAAVEIADIHGVNGTVHVIDTVMLPPAN